jgi:hypothetical protein
MGKFKVVPTVPPVPSDFARLQKLVARGWRKFNEDGRWSVTGSSPYVDLYWVCACSMIDFLFTRVSRRSSASLLER